MIKFIIVLNSNNQVGGGVLDSKALTKLQSVFLAAIIVVATVFGGAGYILFSGQEQSENIKIGFIGDIDNFAGGGALKAVVLAAEQVNAEGGVLGRNFEVVAEDDDGESGLDLAFATNAMNRLLSVENVDFIICHTGVSALLYQDLVEPHNIILFSNFAGAAENATRRVEEDYDKYKFFFASGGTNTTVSMQGTVQSILDCREYTGFNKIALIGGQTGGLWFPFLESSLNAYGFEVVYTSTIPNDAVDFSSYFANAEAAGAEIMYPIIMGPAGIPFVQEYHARQSPMVLWGFIVMASQSSFWEQTDGKCEYTSNVGFPVVAGYPLTNKTLPTREAYAERWGLDIMSLGAAAYDTVRFILPDAIRRAGTIETEAVIEALESVDVETSLARHFVFSTTHGVLVPSSDFEYPEEDYFIVCMFQWQGGVQVPVFPKGIMEDEGVTYAFPPWSGPWD